jgi:hypothetical protein
MDDRAMQRIGIAISVMWLVLCVVRIGLFSAMGPGTGGSGTFATILNILLVVGIVLMVVFLGKGFVRFFAAKAHKDTHCMYCYSKLGPDDQFCPVCGAEEPRKKS